MENYPGNQKTTRVEKTERVVRERLAPETPAKPKIEKVVQGEVKRRKKPLGKRIHETLFGGEDARGVWQFVMVDVLRPAFQDMVADAVTTGVERMIFGGETPRSTNRRGRHTGSSGFVSYNRFGGNSVGGSSIRRDPRERDDPRPSLSRHARRTHDFDEIILATRAEGNEVVDRLFSLVDQYGQASVYDLYEMVGITGDYTDEKWGWDNLRGAGVSRTRAGYVLDLPATIPLT